MTLTRISDAAHFQLLRQDTARLKGDMHRLTSELSTGRHADLGSAVSGDFSGLSDVTRRLALTRSYANGIAQASLMADARQTALGQIEAELSGTAPHLIAVATSGTLSEMTLANAAAPDRFDQAVAVLNTRLAGEALFTGDRLDTAPLLTSTEMLDALRPLVNGAATAEDMIETVEDWFLAPGGGYETAAWQGGAEAGRPVILSEGVQMDAAVTALDPALRSTLAGLALGALVAEGAVPLSESETRTVVSAAAERMLSAEGDVIRLRARLGLTQGRLEEAQVQAEATRAALEIEETRLSEADPYRTATDLEALQTRLESLFILTARLSRLSLSEYLR